ncbi:MAG: hypothetical protein AB7T31_17550 [Gemmatimonadales bacterium]
MSRFGVWIAIAAMFLLGVPAAAQDLRELVADGRYEDAATSLRDVGPAEARAGARLIFEQVYLREYQAGRFSDAVRGFVAAKQVPYLEEHEREMLDFWHGIALVATVRESPAGALSDDEAAALFDEARALFLASGDYPGRVGMQDVVSNAELLLEMSGRANARN